MRQTFKKIWIFAATLCSISINTKLRASTKMDVEILIHAGHCYPTGLFLKDAACLIQEASSVLNGR